MDCAQFKEVIHEMDREGTQGFALRAMALDHAETCAECGELLDDTEALDSALSELAKEDAAVRAPARVEATLLNEFRKQHGAEARPRRNYRLAVLGIAAGFVLVLGFSLRHWIVPMPNITTGGEVASVGSGTRTAGGNSGGGVTVVSGDENASEEDATTTDFVALPFATDPATLEDATIVRVTLSPAALASFGVPVADMGATEQIPADIALSEDGSPQAIRLVSADSAEQSF